MRATIDTHFAPGKTIHELHELVRNGSGIDLLKGFSEAARGVAGIHNAVTVYRVELSTPVEALRTS
jgi:hypothetical protein